MKIYVGILFFIGAQVLAWFQLNSQLLSGWWKERWLLAAVSLGLPASVLFWHAWKLVVESSGSAWSARFLGSSIGLLLFPILTWTLLGESMFTTKTMVCFILSLMIIAIQLFC